MFSYRSLQLDGDFSWDGLVNQSSTATFFQTGDWLKLWTGHFNRDIYIFGVYEGDVLIGIAPFQKTDNKIGFLGTSRVLGEELVSDFGDVIAIKGKEREVWETALLGTRDWGLGTSNNKIEFNFIREDSPSFKILRELGGKAEEIDEAPYIDLPKSWEEYLGKLDRHNRHELRRKIRKVEGEGVVKVCIPFSNHFTDPLTLKDAIQQPLGLLGNCKTKEERYAKGNRENGGGNGGDIDEFFRLMALSNDKKEGFLSSQMKAFFRDVIKTFWQKSMLELCFLKLGEINIAAAITFIYKDEILLYNSGFDPKYSSLSPGFVLKVLAVKDAIEKGKKRFDFLRGRERYKYDLGGVERKLYKITFDQI